jgi:hypothetical protein
VSPMMMSVPTTDVPQMVGGGYAAVPMYTGPAPSYAAAPAAAGGAAGLFDQLDTNHDGVISRAEFAAMTGGR